MNASIGVGNGLLAHLTPYQVGLCCLLTHYAQSAQTSLTGEKGFFELLFREIQAARGPKQKTLREFRDELCKDAQGTKLWEFFIERLRQLNSPDDLFDAFQGLELAISREMAASSPLHAGGIFGQFARCAVLTFKDASFEASVKLFDAVTAYVRAYDSEVQGELVRSDKNQCAGQVVTPCEFSLGTSQLEQLAQGLLRDLPVNFGRLPFLVVDRALNALREKLPLCHVVHFLRYVNCLQHRMADAAASSLRSFHDGHQQRGLAEMQTAAGWHLGVPPEDGLPDLVQHASLALAGLQTEMRHLDDAVQAVLESIHAAQEASDGGCLCACLYMLSLVQMQAGHTDKAFTMMRRCLHGAEAKGLPMLQALCCLGIARALSAQPALSDRRKRGLLWKESISRMAAETQPATSVLRTQGAVGGGMGAVAGMLSSAASNAGARGFGFVNGGSGGVGPRGGLGVLAALLGHAVRDEAAAPRNTPGGGSGSGSSHIFHGNEGQGHEGAACRDSLAHVTLASQLSTQAGSLGEARPKVLLCQAEVARLFGLQPLTAASCGLVLDIYQADLVAEDRALALCQLATAAANSSIERARPLLRDVAQQLPNAAHLWAHIVGPELVRSLTQAGESATASALLFQVAGMVRAVPHGSITQAAQQLRLATNSLRLYHRQLLVAYRSAREAVERGPRTNPPGDVCGHLLCLVDVHLEAQDPVGALGPCLRCLSAAEHARLLHFRAEAMVRLAKIKFHMKDLAGALQLAEEVTPQLSTSGSAKLRGEALMVQADVLLALSAKHKESQASHQRLVREISTVLEGAVDQFKAVAELNPLRRCHYLLARTYHELGNLPNRNAHATSFRKVSEFLDGGGRGRSIKWDDLDLKPGRPLANLDPPRSNFDMNATTSSAHASSKMLLAMPSSLRPSGSTQGSLSVGSSGSVLGNTIMGGACFEDSFPFAHALDAAAAAAATNNSSSQLGRSETIVDSRTGKRSALEHLLALAEAAEADETKAASDAAAQPAWLGSRFASSRAGDFPKRFIDERQQRADEGQTVVGPLRALYPLTAILGA